MSVLFSIALGKLRSIKREGADCLKICCPQWVKYCGEDSEGGRRSRRVVTRWVTLHPKEHPELGHLIMLVGAAVWTLISYLHLYRPLTLASHLYSPLYLGNRVEAIFLYNVWKSFRKRKLLLVPTGGRNLFWGESGWGNCVTGNCQMIENSTFTITTF